MLNLFWKFTHRVVKRCYHQQLMASEVSLWRVIGYGGNWKNFVQLRGLYKSIDASKGTRGEPDHGWAVHEHATFWREYWTVQSCYQPWLVAHLHRTHGLMEGDPFFQNPETERTWLYSDMSDLRIPCAMVWDWIEAAEPKRLESAVLLSSFSHKQLYSELTQRCKGRTSEKIGYLFASMTMAMIFRMALLRLVKDFAREADEWKNMYASWDIEARLFLLSVLGSLDRQESRDYMYAWAPELFPEACGMLDVARATDVHPACLVRQWYEQRGAPIPDTLSVEGLV